VTNANFVNRFGKIEFRLVVPAKSRLSVHEKAQCAKSFGLQL
jgi:hypothetical protein